MYGMCAVAGLQEPGGGVLDRVVSRRVQVEAGGLLVEPGAAFDGIYAVKSGAFKTFSGAEGREKVVDLHFPGELIGLEALEAGNHLFGVVALEASSVCHLHFNTLDALAERYGAFQQALIAGMSDKMRWDQWLSAITAAPRAEQSVAAFLLGVSVRYGERGLPDNTFRLPVSRQEIASYLSLALETVSRIFTRFQDQGLIEARGRHVALTDVPGLAELAGLTLDRELFPTTNR
jgi:CRP/FNR family transcriptional regulator